MNSTALASPVGSKPFHIATGQALPPAEFANRLDSLGYKLGKVCVAPGFAAPEPDGLAVWPFGSPEPLKVCWLGNQVEGIFRAGREIAAAEIGSPSTGAAPQPKKLASKPEPEDDDLLADMSEAERERLLAQEAAQASEPAKQGKTPVFRDVPGASEEDALALAAAFEQRDKADAEIERLKAKLLAPCFERWRREAEANPKPPSAFKAFGHVVFRVTRSRGGVVLPARKARRFIRFMETSDFRMKPSAYSVPKRGISLQPGAANDPEIFDKIESLVGKDNFSKWFYHENGIAFTSDFHGQLFSNPYYYKNKKLEEALTLAGVGALVSKQLMLRVGRAPGAAPDSEESSEDHDES